MNYPYFFIYLEDENNSLGLGSVQLKHGETVLADDKAEVTSQIVYRIDFEIAVVEDLGANLNQWAKCSANEITNILEKA